MKAVIMAGGKGTRLQSVARDIPKPMFPILNKPILKYQIESLKKSGIVEIILIVGHLGNVIREYFKDGAEEGVILEYITEDVPLGTAGALYYLKDKIKEDFILVFGDLLLDIDWNRFMKFHQQKQGWITLFGHPNSHPYDSDVIVTDSDCKVIRIESKNIERDFYYHNFVNAGIYCVSPEILAQIETPKKIDLEKNLIADFIPKEKVYAYRSMEYVKDMGTPERLQLVTEDVKRGLVASRSLKNRQRAIFLDRDGTINVLKGFLTRVEDFEMLAGVSEAIKKINSSDYLTIVATNQPVLARGECTWEELEKIHMRMETELGKQGAYIDDLFYCPHHPHNGYDGEVPELKIECQCRKPSIGMIQQAADKYNIDLDCSWYIGDTTVDIKTGINAGMKTILLKTGEAGQDKKYDVEADYVAADLLQAVDIVLNA